MGDVLTFRIIACVPFPVSSDLLSDLENNNSATKSDSKPAASTGQPSYSLSEL